MSQAAARGVPATKDERDRILSVFREYLNMCSEENGLMNITELIMQCGVFGAPICRGDRPTRAQTRLGRQMEKDERFWVVTALMSLYNADKGPGREEQL